MSPGAAVQASEATRQRLLDAAWSVVRRDGLRAATSRRIAAEANANLGAITYHFGSKNTLLSEAAVQQLTNSLSAWLQPLSAVLLADRSPGGPHTNEYIASSFDTIDSSIDDGRALLEVLISGREIPEAADAIRAQFTAFHQLLGELMRQQKHRGEIPDTVNPPAMAGVFTAFALGLVVQEIMGANPAPPAEIIGQLLSLLALPLT